MLSIGHILPVLDNAECVVYKDIRHCGMRKYCPVCENETALDYYCNFCGTRVENIDFHFNKSEYDEDIDDIKMYLVYDIQKELKSMEATGGNEDGVELILEDNYCQIGVGVGKKVMAISLRCKYPNDEVAELATKNVAYFLKTHIGEKTAIKELIKEIA